MPPPGGTRTPIPVSYFWGAPGSMSGGQDQTSRFAEVFQPQAGIFSPNYPLVPVDAERLRVWDYPVGYNYVYTPRAYEPVGFAEILALANNHDITRLAIETRKDQIEKLTWDIRPREDRDFAPDAEERADRVRGFWEYPDGEQPFATWLREAMENVLVPDAAAFEVRRNRGGEIIGLDNIDGTTIKVLIDHTGRRPTPPAPAFEQIIHGRPWRLMTSDELIYSPRNVRPGHVHGFGPVEQIIMTINIGLRRQIMQLQHFTESNIPVGLLNAPDGWTAQQIKQFEENWNAVLSGNTAERVSSRWVPWGAKWQAMKEPPFKDEFDEWLARVVMFCFSLPPDAFIRQRSRAAAQTAQQTALEEGLAPYMGWVKRFADSMIQKRLGHPDLEFAWQEIKQTDPKVQSETHNTYVRAGVETINEARDDLGLDPIDGGDEPLFLVATGPIFLKDALRQSEQEEQASLEPAAPLSPLGGAAAGSPAPGSPPPGAGGVKPAGLPAKAPGEPVQREKPQEVGKAATTRFRPSLTPALGSSAQRRLDAAGRAAVAAEAQRLLRGSLAARRGAGGARVGVR
jgi:hypothetical protein